MGLEVVYKCVPKWLTLPAAFVGVLMNLYFNGLIVGLQSIAAWIVGASAMIAAGRLQPTGKGTVLLLAAVGSFLGVGGVLVAFVFFSLLCGIVMLGTIIRNLVTDVVATPVVETDEKSKEGGESAVAVIFEPTQSSGFSLPRFTVPLSPAIAIAAILTILYEGQTLTLIGLK